MEIQSKKNIIIGVILVFIIVMEIGVIINSYLTIKYKIEDNDNKTAILNLVYSMAHTLSAIIVFDIIILIVAVVWILKN